MQFRCFSLLIGQVVRRGPHSEAQAPQPTPEVHDGALNGLPPMIVQLNLRVHCCSRARSASIALNLVFHQGWYLVDFSCDDGATAGIV